MKVILSRKGFDSANGGIVSPIMEDGTLLTFPIPADSDDRDSFKDLMYCDRSYCEILADLKYKEDPTYPNCHLDPDLSMDRRKQAIDDWRPIFGQVSSSALYLENSVLVKPGDLFLFFGNYHKVKYCDGKYEYVKRTGDFYSDNDLQVIWGYLQVGEIIRDPEAQRKYYWHPHAGDWYTKQTSNTMFLATERLTFNEELPGAGLLSYREDRVLTAPNCNKATWVKRSVYDVDSVIGNRKNSSKNPNGIYYAGIWQELGLKETANSEEWAKSLIQQR